MSIPMRVWPYRSSSETHTPELRLLAAVPPLSPDLAANNRRAVRQQKLRNDPNPNIGHNVPIQSQNLQGKTKPISTNGDTVLQPAQRQRPVAGAPSSGLPSTAWKTKPF